MSPLTVSKLIAIHKAGQDPVIYLMDAVRALGGDISYNRVVDLIGRNGRLFWEDSVLFNEAHIRYQDKDLAALLNERDKASKESSTSRDKSHVDLSKIRENYHNTLESLKKPEAKPFMEPEAAEKALKPQEPGLFDRIKEFSGKALNNLITLYVTRMIAVEVARARRENEELMGLAVRTAIEEMVRQKVRNTFSNKASLDLDDREVRAAIEAIVRQQVRAAFSKRSNASPEDWSL